MANDKPSKALLLVDAQATLGEGPVWDQRRQKLFWVDIEGRTLYRYDPISKEGNKWDFEEMIGAAIPKDDGNLLLALESGLATFDFDTLELARHQVLENSDPKIRFNDGKCDSIGNLWIGTMHKQVLPNTGNFYKVSTNMEVAVAIKDTTISNGMGWSPDNKKFYYIDTATYEVVCYNFDDIVGSIKSKKSIFSIPKSYGGPDGMCIDQEGMLWIAHWGGNCVRRWDPNTGEVLEIVEIDAPNVTSCCFGGKNLDTLFITTARSGLDDEQLKEFPLSGGLFYRKPGVSGFPTNYFKTT